MSAGALPETFGRHRVIRPLGQGGMGTVYLALDTMLERQVAVKVPHFDKYADPEMIQRFLREAKAAASIEHPNVCPVWDVGEQGDGYYLVMPYLEGTPLSRLVGRGRPWEAARALGLLHRVAGGVRAIHEKGIIHRDLKPGNILMRGDEPVILDLGLARSLSDERERLTATGRPLGTPAYMAPEQLLGEPDRLGPWTDVYALGVILYELLTGQIPFAGSIHTIYTRILHDTPRAPSAVRPGLGGELDALCLKAMSKEPDQRHRGAEEFGQAVLAAWHTLDPDADEHSRVTPTRPALPIVERPPQDTRPTSPPTLPLSGRRGRGKMGRWAAGLAGVAILAGLCGVVVWQVVSGGRAEVPPAEPPDNGGERRAGGEVGPGPKPPPVVPKPPPVIPKPPPAVPKPPPQEVVNSLGMKLVLVPAGRFLMGSPEGEKDRNDDELQHEVEIGSPFYLGAFEVTQEQYEKVMSENPSSFKKDNGGGPDHPVERVSWDEAVAFCEKLSGLEAEKSAGRRYRLPTEAEWEYACREAGRSKAPFHFGDTLTSGQANFDGNYPYGTDADGPYLRRTAPVGSYKPNALGLYDVHGNVWEWCADRYGKYPEGPVKDPTGPAEGAGRVLRGGGWVIEGFLCRSAARRQNEPGAGSNYIGFRVVLTPDSQARPGL